MRVILIYLEYFYLLIAIHHASSVFFGLLQ